MWGMILKCPYCNNPLTLVNKSYVCDNHHSFDLAKQGYLHLDTNHKSNKGDDAFMVNQRINFLNDGFYDFLVDKLQSIMDRYHVTTLLDYACGPGYYCSKFNVTEKIGIDLSKSAIKYAAAHDKSSMYLVANGFHLPFYDNTFDCITIVFAPLSYDEFYRLLKPNGIVIIVSPASDHLFEIKQALYEKPYLNKPFEVSDPRFKVVDTITVSQQKIMNTAQLNACFDMTPYRYKTSKQALEKLQSIDQLNVTTSFTITLLKRYE